MIIAEGDSVSPDDIFHIPFMFPNADRIWTGDLVLIVERQRPDHCLVLRKGENVSLKRTKDAI
jgi:hypothetical protein